VKFSLNTFDISSIFVTRRLPARCQMSRSWCSSCAQTLFRTMYLHAEST